jgi:hypothetical protein
MHARTHRANSPYSTARRAGPTPPATGSLGSQGRVGMAGMAGMAGAVPPPPPPPPPLPPASRVRLAPATYAVVGVHVTIPQALAGTPDGFLARVTLVAEVNDTLVRPQTGTVELVISGSDALYATDLLGRAFILTLTETEPQGRHRHPGEWGIAPQHWSPGRPAWGLPRTPTLLPSQTPYQHQDATTNPSIHLHD